MHIYDYIVIGSGLAGLSVASKISQHSKNILLIESEPVLGGATKAAHIKNIPIENGLRFVPGLPAAQKAIEQLEDQINLKLVRKIKEHHVETYDAGGFKDFIGFGAHAPAFYHQISYFLSSHELELTLPFYEVMSRLKEKYGGETLVKSFVTAFNFDGPKLTHVTVNGGKPLYGNHFVFAGNVRDLANLLPEEILGARAKAKLRKDTAWSALCLDLYHDCGATPVTKKNLFLLDGTTNDTVGPCIGKFWHPQEAQDVNGAPHHVQISQWVSFVDVDTVEETENLAEVLKKMKRQIKRAFPEAVEAIKGERLFMSAALSVGEIKLHANGTLAKTENLWIASGAVHEQPNLVGTLLQSQLTLASLGFAPAPHRETSADRPDEVKNHLAAHAEL